MPQCPDLPRPENGAVVYRSVQVGSVAVYSCNDGYVLSGSALRTCEGDGSWSGQAPVCNTGMNPHTLGSCIISLILAHSVVCTVELVGQVEVNGDTATYSFTGVGSGITGYTCKLDGTTLPDCMLYSFILCLCVQL